MLNSNASGKELAQIEKRMSKNTTDLSKAKGQLGRTLNEASQKVNPHYAKTLECWRHRFEGSAYQVATIFDEPFVRAWRLYLTGSLAAFRTGCLQLFQVLFTRHGINDIPSTRKRMLE